jgi:hypothetical protein
MVKDAFDKPASIIFSTLLPLIPTGNAIYPTYGFCGFLSRLSWFLTQLQRIVAQLHKILYAPGIIELQVYN